VNTDLALAMSQEMLMTAAMVAAPVLGVALIVGLTVSIFQVVTQIQEMTLTFVPKILAVVGVFFVCGPWMLQTLMAFATHMITNIPNIIGH